eukprot:scaffold15294_cov75-Skeletonema_dohrnii-CCMP3373.AAC.6
MTIISLVKSAFGRKATLYTPLNCTKTSSESDLRSAYKKAALRCTKRQLFGSIQIEPMRIIIAVTTIMMVTPPSNFKRCRQ